MAYVAVHILLEQQLGWFELFDDTPTAIAGEVGGAGDDAAVEFRVGTPTVEIQAKHGLQGLQALVEVLLAKIEKALEAHPDVTIGLPPASETGGRA
jgi:hypothetical protein